MKIILESHADKIVTCGRCESIIEFDMDDLQSDEPDRSGIPFCTVPPKNWLICPICGTKLFVKYWSE